MNLPAKYGRWSEKHPILGTVFFVIVTVLIGGSGWIMPLVRPDKVNCNPHLSCPNPQKLGSNDVNRGQTPVCRTESFDPNRWDMKGYHSNKDNFWCPKSVWQDPVVWYKDGIKPGFSSISIEYEIEKDPNFSTANPPSFVAAYGNKLPVFKSWTSEGENYQLFRFAKNLDLNRTILTSDDAEELSSSAKPYQKDWFVIEQNKTLDNGEVLLNFTYKYISNFDQRSRSDTFPKKIRMPGSDPALSSVKYPFGIGTYLGNCIKPITLYVCE